MFAVLGQSRLCPYTNQSFFLDSNCETEQLLR